MNYLDELRESILEENKRLKNQKEAYLNIFVTIDLENNILTQINEDLINYFKNNLNNYSLNEEELISINKSFNYFNSINSLGIDLSNLYFEDKNLRSLKENIKLLYKKSIEYKNIIISNIDSEISNNNDVLNTINRIKELLESNNIDLEIVHNLISSLSIKDQLKFNIYKEIYNKYLISLKSKDKNIEIFATELFEEIIAETKPSLEIEDKIDRDGIRLKITEKDRALQEQMQVLYSNIMKLKDKLPSNDEVTGKPIEEIEKINKNKAKYAKLVSDMKQIMEELETYLGDKDTIWESDYQQNDVENYLNDLFNDLLNKYKECSKTYQELYDLYGSLYRTGDQLISLETVTNDNNLTPIIFFVEGVDRFIQGYEEKVPTSLENELNKNYKFITKIKQNLENLKQRNLSSLETDKIDGVKNEFREIKVVNRTKNDLAIRIYYKFCIDSNGTSYPVVFMIYAKPDSKPKQIYEHISKVIGSKYFKDFMNSLPEQSKLSKVIELEELVYQKIIDIENQNEIQRERRGTR